jgi:uncharacterized phage protein gp47/JayE
MTYGVIPTGFSKKTLENIKAEIEDDLRDLSGNPRLNFLANGPIGQHVGIISDQLRELWDVAEAIYRALYPDSASDEALDQIASLTNAIRLPATKSEVILDQLYLNTGVTIPAGSIVSIGETGARWVTQTEVSNTTGVQGTFSTDAKSESTGEINGYATTIDSIITGISGWLDTPGLTNTVNEPFNLDGTALVLKVDGGFPQSVNFSGGDPWSASSVAAEINSQTTGLTCLAVSTKVRVVTDTAQGSVQITSGLANAVLGFSTDLVKGFNTADATVGTELEEDPAFRIRRLELLRQTGKATVEAIRASLRALDNVIQALVLENTAFDTDSEGLPGKSFESIVQSGDSQEIADEIWNTKPAGIEAYGSESETVVDSMGISHTIKFSRPVEVPIYIKITAAVDFSIYPIDGDTQIKEALINLGDAQQVGEDVVALQYQCAPLTIAGVEDVTDFIIDETTIPPGTNESNITIEAREIATFDTSRIEVISVSV